MCGKKREPAQPAFALKRFKGQQGHSEKKRNKKFRITVKGYLR
jgi:hypothetical protein